MRQPLDAGWLISRKMLGLKGVVLFSRRSNFHHLLHLYGRLIISTLSGGVGICPAPSALLDSTAVLLDVGAGLAPSSSSGELEIQGGRVGPPPRVRRKKVQPWAASGLLRPPARTSRSATEGRGGYVGAPPLHHLQMVAGALHV